MLATSIDQPSVPDTIHDDEKFLHRHSKNYVAQFEEIPENSKFFAVHFDELTVASILTMKAVQTL
jgi:hypothetical protein